jgi:K+-sensing histidine kinase KdpD
MIRSILERGPQSLLLRVRWLFLILGLLVATIVLIDLPRWDVPWWPRGVLGSVAVITMCAWVVYRYRRPDAPLLTDVLPLAVIATLGLTAPSPDDGFGVAFVLLCYRVMFADRRTALVSGVTYYAAFLVPYVIVEPEEAISDPVGALLVLLFFVLVAAIMQALADAARQHELATERERILLQLSQQLLQADSERTVELAAVQAAARVSGAGATAAVWLTRDEDRSGPTSPGGSAAPVGVAPLLARFPTRSAEELGTGEPLLFDGAEAQTIAAAFGQHLTHPQLLVVPLVDGARLEGIVVVVPGALPLHADDRGVMKRFANEVVLGLERVRLTDDLRRANTVKDQFLSMVSHELRTPLTVVRGLVETLLDHRAAIGPDVRDQFLQRMQAQALRQQRLIDDLLTTSQVMAGQLSLAPTELDVGQLVEGVATELGVAEQVTLLSDDVVPRVWADRLHVIQILGNLLTNATKYGAPPFEIRIRKDLDEVVTCVRDHGPGIGVPDAEVLFEPFEQAAGNNRAVGGVGLGLSIVRRLALANAGSVEVCSAASSGACFAVRLPVVPPRPA